MAKVDFDQSEHGVSEPREGGLMPKGRYLAIAVKSEDKKTKARDGRYYEYEFKIMAPKEYKGRHAWARLNVHNPSSEAQRIGREQFNALAAACGKLGKVKQTEDLHNIPVILLIGIEEGTNGNDDQNRVNGFMRYEGDWKPSEEDRQASSRGTAQRRNNSDGGEEQQQNRGRADAPPPRSQQQQPQRKGGSFDEMDDDIPF